MIQHPPEVANCEAIAYVDGSFLKAKKLAGAGAVVFYNNDVYEFSEPTRKYVEMWQVAGELKAVALVVDFAWRNKISQLGLVYDYTGIEGWATGAWSANKPGTTNYKEWMSQPAFRNIHITYFHVRGHTGVVGNEWADHLAKQACGLLPKGVKFNA